MDDLQLLVNFHIEDDRQGPGSVKETKRAIELAGLNKNTRLKIADLGCGTGASTLVLAKELNAQITAIDFLPEFLEVLKARAEKEGFCHIKTQALSIDNLPFENEELDVIWSEGAIYNIGFKKGVNLWKKFLKQGGILAVSEITWLTEERPKELDDYWSTEYPEIATAPEKIKVLEKAGFEMLGHFNLSEECWIDNYYKPIQNKFSSFMEQQGHSEEASQLVEMQKKEIELYEKYKDYYSYGFYVAKKIC